MEVGYQTTAYSTGGRSGKVSVDDGTLSFDMSPPGSDKPGVNPEQLFAACFSACFGGPMRINQRCYSVH